MGIDFAGKHSYRDFGLKIKYNGRDIGMPAKDKVLASVPFMSGAYDFSELYGSQAYGERMLEYVFFVHGSSVREMESKRIEVLNFFNNQQKAKLFDDGIQGFFFEAECISAVWFENDFVGELTVQFRAHPFMFGANFEGHDIWDEFNFILDIAQNTTFTIQGSTSITLHNLSATSVVPVIIASNPMQITRDGITYQIPAGESKNWEFRLNKGVNNLTITSGGDETVEFRFRKEVV